MCSLRVGKNCGDKMAEEHKSGHKQPLKQPVPEELGRDVALIKTHNPEVGNHEEHRRHQEIGDLYDGKEDHKIQAKKKQCAQINKTHLDQRAGKGVQLHIVDA